MINIEMIKAHLENLPFEFPEGFFGVRVTHLPTNTQVGYQESCTTLENYRYALALMPFRLFLESEWVDFRVDVFRSY